APMTMKAQKRNREAIDAGKADFLVFDFKKIALPNAYYDAVVAFNVNFFWKDPKAELEIIKNTLKPEGRLFVLYQSPFEIEISAADPISNELTENGCKILDIRIQKFEPTSAFCITAHF